MKKGVAPGKEGWNWFLLLPLLPLMLALRALMWGVKQVTVEWVDRRSGEGELKVRTGWSRKDEAEIDDMMYYYDTEDLDDPVDTL